MVLYRVNLAEHCWSATTKQRLGSGSRGNCAATAQRNHTGERAATQNATAATATARLSFVWLLSPCPCPEVPGQRPSLVHGSMLDPGSLGRFWVVNHTVGSRLEKRRVSNQVTARPPPPPTARHFQCCTAETLAAWSMAMEHGAWNDGARPVLGSAAVRCGAGAMWCYSRLPPPFCHSLCLAS